MRHTGQMVLALAIGACIATANAQERPQEEGAPQGWFGVTISTSGTVDERGNASYNGYPVVTGVEAGSPAASAGVQVRDVLISFNSHDMKSDPTGLRDLLQPGTNFVVRLRRGEEVLDVKGVIAPRPASFQDRVVMIWSRGDESGDGRPMPGMNTVGIRVRPPMPVALPPVLLPIFGYGEGIYPFAGAEFTALNNDLRRTLGIKREGVFVTDVAPGSPARVSGLRGGDVVLVADSTRLDGPLALVRAIREADDRSIRLSIVRERRLRTITLRW